MITLAGCHKTRNPSPPPTPRSGKTVAVTWTASVTPGVSYNVYRANHGCSDSSGFNKLNSVLITTTNYDDLNVAAGTYCYYATSYLQSADPSESEPSNKAEVIIQTQPVPPTNLTVTPSAVTLNLNEQQQFVASREGVTWSLSPILGTISTTGLYVAPSSIQGNNIQVEVSAHDSEGIGRAIVTLRKK